MHMVGLITQDILVTIGIFIFKECLSGFMHMVGLITQDILVTIGAVSIRYQINSL